MSHMCVKDMSVSNINSINNNTHHLSHGFKLKNYPNQRNEDTQETTACAIARVKQFIKAHQQDDSDPRSNKPKREERSSPDSSQSPEPGWYPEHQIKVTRCPVCQKYVPNLPQHISLQHPQAAGLGRASAHLESGNSSSGSGHNSPTSLVSSSSSSRDSDPFHQSAMDVASLPQTSVPLFLQRQSGLHPMDQTGAEEGDNMSVIPNLLRLSGVNHMNGDDLKSSQLLQTTQELFRVAAGSNRMDALPMNLSVKKGVSRANYTNGNSLDSVVKGLTHGVMGMGRDHDDSLRSSYPPTINSMSDSESVGSGSDPNSLTRKRRKQTHVPENKKDERYWARRHKNNEAAKRSRDMRIKREKVVFEENARLERITSDLKGDYDKLTTENKELNLKMELILDENTRLKSLLLNYQSREEINRRSSRDVDLSEQARGGTSASPNMRPFPFPDGK